MPSILSTWRINTWIKKVKKIKGLIFISSSFFNKAGQCVCFNLYSCLPGDNTNWCLLYDPRTRSSQHQKLRTEKYILRKLISKVRWKRAPYLCSAIFVHIVDSFHVNILTPWSLQCVLYNSGHWMSPALAAWWCCYWLYPAAWSWTYWAPPLSSWRPPSASSWWTWWTKDELFSLMCDNSEVVTCWQWFDQDTCKQSRDTESVLLVL